MKPKKEIESCMHEDDFLFEVTDENEVNKEEKKILIGSFLNAFL